jgi:hypothetical protein
MSARRTRAPWSDKASTPKQRPRPVSAVEPEPPVARSAPEQPSLTTRYPIGRRDGLLFGGLAFLVAGAVIGWVAANGGSIERDSAEIEPIRAAARRAFPGEDEVTALRKLGARLDELYPAKAAVAPSGPRGIGASQRAALVATLKSETGPVKKAWLSVQSTNAEAVTFQKWLQAAFEEAGWQVETSPWPGGGLKPGVFFFAAEEKNPDFVETAQRALDAAGIKVTAAIGYRAFYQEKKKENPSWAGIDMKGDQAYAIVIGPKEEGSAAPAP